MPAVIFSGNKVKTLKKRLDLFTGVAVISSTDDPTSVSTDAPIGSLLINESTGNIYRKNDSGSSTNWTQLVSEAVIPSGNSRSSPQDITASGITVSNKKVMYQKIYVQGSGGNVDVTGVPQVTAGVSDGQELLIVGRNDAQTVLLENGNGLSLNGPCELGEDDSIKLSWDGTNWVEISRS